MRHRRLSCAVVLLAGLLAFAAQAEPRYRIQELALPSDASGVPLFIPEALNNRGEVVGAARGDPSYRGYLYSAGRLRPLAGDPGGDVLTVNGINDRGQVVGSLRANGGLRQTPFLYGNGQYRELTATLDRELWGQATAINARGQVVGVLGDRAFFYDGTQARYIPIPDEYQTLWPALNDHGVVAGMTVIRINGGFEPRAYVYDGRQTTLLPQPYQGIFSLGVADINNAGQMAAYYRSDAGLRSFIYQDGKFTDLGNLGASFLDTVVRGLNDQGWAVGSSLVAADGGSRTDGFLYRDGQMFNFNALLRPRDAARWRVENAEDINDRGQIIGYGYLDGGTLPRGFIATPVPEPGSWALLLGGLALAGGVARRRQPA